MSDISEYRIPDQAPEYPEEKERPRPQTVEAVAPCSIDGERVLLGAVLLDPACFNEIAEALTPEDFFLDSHRRIFQRMADLIDAQQAVDLVTLCAELDRHKERESVGGAAFISGLTDGLPRRPQIADYIRIVKEKSQLRRLMAICSSVLSRAADQSETAMAVLEDAESQLLEVAQESNTSKLRDFGSSVTQAGGPDQYIRQYTEPNLKVGLPTGFIDYDRLTGGLQKGELTIIAARPAQGKTSISMNILENVCCGTDMVAAFFSLEMSRPSVERRFMASRARVDIKRAMEGEFLSSEEKRKLQKALNDLVESRIFIDDCSNMTPIQMRAKGRRLKQREGRLDLVVIDYISLVSGDKKTQNREQEVALVSRSLKAMSKELDCPVIALAQLNRNNEQRQDKRPVLSDLRECLSEKDTFLFTSGGVQSNMESPMNTYSLSNEKIKPVPSFNVPKGVSQAIRVRTRSGREIVCTPNHSILTDVGWVKAKDLTPDHAIAAARKIDSLPGRISIPESRWIGRMLGNGSMLGYSSPSFICSCADVAKDFCEDTERLFGLIPRYHKHSSDKVFQYDITTRSKRTREGNPVKNWLMCHDLWGKKAHEKSIPEWFMEQADDESIANMIAGLVETDGSVFTTSVPMVKYSTTSKKMAWQFMWCLSRLGVFAKIDEGDLSPKANFVCYSVLIQEGKEVDLFRSKINLVGRKGRTLLGLNPSLHGSNHGDRLGVWVSSKLREISLANGMSYGDLGYRSQGKRISQVDLSKALSVFSRRGIKVPELSVLINSYIFWDRLKRIDAAGDVKVFDRIVPGPNNFIANGIVVHNSGQIEQDADVLNFVHRPEYYDRDNDELKGIAELICAKHRNGATRTIHLAFEGSLTRFDNIARR